MLSFLLALPTFPRLHYYSFLQLKPSKMGVLWCASARRLHQLPTTSVQLGNVLVSPMSTVLDLDFHLNSDVTLTTHVASTVALTVDASQF
jgi:hypothetical protein